MSNSENLNEWRVVYKDLLIRRTTLQRWNNLHVKVYKCLGYFLSLATPLLAALVTYLSAASHKTSASITGLLLTFFAVLNEVLKPHQRFLAAVQLSHELEEFKTNVTIELRRLLKADPRDLDEIYEVLSMRNRELSVVGEAMAMGTLST